jgi:hypothetical protein
VKAVEFKLSINGSLFARNVARGNWTSPVLSSCPAAGFLAVNQQDERAFINALIGLIFNMLFIKRLIKRILMKTL